jgi:DNA modification methylase
LPAWFIKLFTKPGDVVLDPFLGSGTTAIAAAKAARKFVGIEVRAEYCELARKGMSDLGDVQPELNLCANDH